MWNTYTWIVVCGALLSLFVAYGIGANDVANAFGSSVGSKAINIRQALLIAAIFEFSGAVLLGANVTETVRKVKQENKQLHPEVTGGQRGKASRIQVPGSCPRLRWPTSPDDRRRGLQGDGGGKGLLDPASSSQQIDELFICFLPRCLFILRRNVPSRLGERIQHSTTQTRKKH